MNDFKIGDNVIYTTNSPPRALNLKSLIGYGVIIPKNTGLINFDNNKEVFHIEVYAIEFLNLEKQWQYVKLDDPYRVFLKRDDFILNKEHDNASV